MRRRLVLLTGIVISCAAVSFSVIRVSDDGTYDFLHTDIWIKRVGESATAKPTTMLFVGDIMLGRAVETLIEREGIAYPFYGVKDILPAYDITVGNFEGVVSLTHVQTPSMGFQFSIKDEYLEYLSRAGFDILSLANNHSLDFGTTSLVHTRTLCTAYGIVCAGTPIGVNGFSTFTKAIGDMKIGFFFLHTLYGAPTENEIANRAATLRDESDIQFAFVHWGEEYEPRHSDEQEALARILIDHGIDAVVGHHPHVVQDVALHQGKPIFYSLGNFIFDQYFSADVQRMLALGVSIEDETLRYSLIPLSSEESRSQPRPMNEHEGALFIASVLGSLSDTNELIVQR